MLKFKFSNHSIAFSIEKAILSESERNMHRSSTVYKRKQSKTNKSVDFDVRGQQGIDLSTGGSVMDYGVVFWPKAMVWCLKTLQWWICLWTRSLLFLKTLPEGLDWSDVDYCDVFISSLDSHSDGTHSLQWILWWTSDIMLNFSQSVLMNQTNLHLGWPERESNISKFPFSGRLFL